MLYNSYFAPDTHERTWTESNWTESNAEDKLA